MLSNGISAPSGLQCSQDSISRSALSRVAASMSTTFCCSGVGSKAVQGNPVQPIVFQLQWSATPEWLPSVTVNQQLNHITTSTDRAEETRQLIDDQPNQPRRLK